MEHETGLQKRVSPNRIVVQPMKERAELRDIDEDWTGKTSTALRRKLQNRLNQRAKRRRAQALQAPSVSAAREDGYIPLEVILMQIPSREICMEPWKRQWVVDAWDYSAFTSHPKLTVSPDHKLLTLLHFNLIRALTRMTLLLGVNPDDMHLDINSPFHNAASKLSFLELPPNLRPTALQLTVPHHPEMDIFPFPTFRDNMILSMDIIDDVAFCQDLVYGVDDGSGAPRGVNTGQCARNDPNGRTGLIVWDDPWLQSSWEVEPEFAKKYKVLMRGCGELIVSTNRWRESRGEEPLDLSE